MKTVRQTPSNMHPRIPFLLAVATIVLTVAVISPGPVLAEGALAIGLPADVAKDGVAFGYAVSFASQEKAQATAMHHCRTTKESSDAARALCRVVETFRGGCVAISMDPQAGTPGVGWALAATKPEAEQRALQACIATAGEARRGACQISISVCDKDK